MTIKLWVSRKTYSRLIVIFMPFISLVCWCNKAQNTKEECKCTKNLRLILDTVHDFRGSKENSIIYASDMISTINHYYNTKDTLITNKSAKEVLVDLIKDVDRETPLKLEISRDEGINKINEQTFPQFRWPKCPIIETLIYLFIFFIYLVFISFR